MSIDDAFDNDEGFPELENIRNAINTLNNKFEVLSNKPVKEVFSNRPNCWFNNEAVYKSSFDKKHNVCYCLIGEAPCVYYELGIKGQDLCNYKGGFKE